ncbi:MAG: hypothetical protein WD847_13285 [Pirellulales bacterium]
MPLNRCQFRLRTLFVCMFGLSICMAWLGCGVQRAKRQEEAVAALKGCGAVVDYDYEINTDGQLTGAAPPGPPWLKAILGDDCFRAVVAVHFRRRSRITDADLAPLRSLTSLEEVNLQGTAISGLGLKHVACLPRLRSLNLGHTEVGDTGIAFLRSSRSLEWLALHYTAISDDGVGYLKDLHNLKCLDLTGTQLSDAGLRQLGELSNLEFLFLRETNVTEDGIESLTRRLRRCEIVSK